MKKPIFAFLVLVKALLKLFELELPTACWSREFGFHLSVTLFCKQYFLSSNRWWCLANLRLQVRIHYRSGTDGHCCIGVWQMLRVHSPCGSTFLREMTSWHLESVTSNQTSHSVNRCVFTWKKHSSQISSLSDLKRQSLRIFEDGRPNKKKNKMSSDIRSVPDVKRIITKINWSSQNIVFVACIVDGLIPLNFGN